jgi:hypothetical protein
MNRKCLVGAVALAVCILASVQARSADQMVAATTKVIPASNSRLVGKVLITRLALLAPRPRLKAPASRTHRRPDGSLTSGLPKALSKFPSMPLIRTNTLVVPPSQRGGPQAPQQPNAGPPPFASLKGFIGVHAKDNATVIGGELEPPDQGLAVHNNVAAEINNLVLQFFDATTGAPKLPNPVDLRQLFLPSISADLSDPQAFYDPTANRWFFTIIEYDQAAIENIDVAVSASGNPLGGYFVYHVRAYSNDLAGCGAFDCLPDYPKTGYDANGLYVSVNLFNASTSNFVAAATYALPKSKLIAGAGFGLPYTRFTYPSDFVVQPSVPAPGEPFVTAANGTEYLLTARHIVDGTHNVRLWAISNTKLIATSPASLPALSVTIPIENYGMTVPSVEPSEVGAYCKSQGAAASPLLDGGYESFTATVQMAHDSTGKLLFAALAFGTSDPNFLLRDSVAWVALRPAVDITGHPSVSIVKQGYVVPGTGYSASYPAFAVTNTGVGALGLTITNQSFAVTGGYPSAAIVPFNFATSPQTGAIAVSGPGTATDDGFSGCPGGATRNTGRWGDYGAGTIDTSTGFFYTANENISGAVGKYSNWGTFITQMH